MNTAVKEKAPFRQLPDGRWLVRNQSGLDQVLKRHIAETAFQGQAIKGCQNIHFPCVVRIYDHDDPRQITVSHRPINTEIKLLAKMLEELTRE